MTAEHVKPLIENHDEEELLCQVAELLSRGHVPPDVLNVIRMGSQRGRVRGIVVGDILRRLVARTVAQQIRKKVERATAPLHQKQPRRLWPGSNRNSKRGIRG